MPLHFTGLVSRYNLRHPDEESPSPPVYDHVLKYNPHHDPQTGRFSAGSGGMNMRRGGTEGSPTEDAFGHPLKPRRGPSSPYKPAVNPAAISLSNAGRRASAQAVFQSSAKTPLNRAISKVPLKQRAEAARQFVKQQRRTEFKALGKRS